MGMHICMWVCMYVCIWISMYVYGYACMYMGKHYVYGNHVYIW